MNRPTIFFVVGLFYAYVSKQAIVEQLKKSQSERLKIDFKEIAATRTRSPMRNILGAPPPENVRKNCIKRDFTRHKKRAIAQHTKAYVSNRVKPCK